MIRLLPVSLLFLLFQSASAQQIVATDAVTIKTLNKSNNGKFLGRTHRHLNELQIYDLDSLWGVNLVTENGGIKCFSFSPDDERVAFATYHGFIEVWEIRSRTRIWVRQAHNAQVNDIKFTHDGGSLISADIKGRILISAVSGIAPKMEIETNTNINALELVPTNDSLFVTGDHEGNIKLWRIGDGALMKHWHAHDTYIFDLIFDKQGQKLFSSSHDGLIKMWDPESPALLKTFRGHEKTVYTLDLSRDGKRLASGGMDNTVILWDVVSGKVDKRYEGHTDYVMVVRFINDNTIMSGSRDFTLRSWGIQ